MQPQQPNYDFIMNPYQPPKQTRFSLGNGATPMRILALAVGAAVIILIIGIMFHTFLGNSSLNKTAMFTILEDQSELAHLSTIGVQSSGAVTTQNFSATLSTVMPSEQTAFITFLATQHYKVDAKKLAKTSVNPTLDAQLTAAQSSSSFDTAYSDIMQQELQKYMTDLNAPYKTAGPHTRAALKERYANAQLLLTQLTGKTAQ